MSDRVDAHVLIRFTIEDVVDPTDLDRIGGMSYFKDIVTSLLEEEGLDAIVNGFTIAKITCTRRNRPGRLADVFQDG